MRSKGILEACCRISFTSDFTNVVCTYLYMACYYICIQLSYSFLDTYPSPPFRLGLMAQQLLQVEARIRNAWKTQSKQGQGNVNKLSLACDIYLLFAFGKSQPFLNYLPRELLLFTTPSPFTWTMYLTLIFDRTPSKHFRFCLDSCSWNPYDPGGRKDLKLLRSQMRLSRNLYWLLGQS